jgi:cell division protein FtsL
MQIIQSIQNRIYEVRGERVMLDFDLARLYEVETKVLNQAVKRNLSRFPDDFMFRLTAGEWETLRSQFVTLSKKAQSAESLSMRSQFVTAPFSENQPLRIEPSSNQNKRNSLILPYAFTEQGVAMLSGVLRSEKAINMNIAIMRAFVAVRKIVLQQSDLKEQIKEIRQQIGEHDTQLSQIYDALENLLDEKAAQRKWDDRQRIGFKN